MMYNQHIYQTFITKNLIRMMYNQHIYQTSNKVRLNIHVHTSMRKSELSLVPNMLKTECTSYHNHVHINEEITPSCHF
jgi:hypothetical protein